MTDVAMRVGSETCILMRQDGGLMRTPADGSRQRWIKMHVVDNNCFEEGSEQEERRALPISGRALWVEGMGWPGILALANGT